MRHRIALLSLLLTTPLLAQDQGRPNPQTHERWRGRVLFLIDASSSMKLGDRFAEAQELVIELQAKLHPSSRFDLVLVHTTNQELYEACKTATPKRIERSQEWLQEASPSPTTASPIAEAIKHALRRKPDKIVLISDGVVTPGLRRSELGRLEKLVRKAKSKTHIDCYAVQSGSYAPAPEVEDLAAGLTFLQALASWSEGSFAVTSAPSPAPRLPVAKAEPPEVKLLQFRDDRVLPPQVPMGQIFRVRIDDPSLADMGWVEVPEYGSPVSLVVSVVDPASGIEIDRSPVIGLRREGGCLTAARAVELFPAARELPKGARRALPLRARPGDLVIANYARGQERAKAQAWIEKEEGVIVVGGSVARCSCCTGGGSFPPPPARPVSPTPAPAPAQPGRPLPPGGGEKPTYTSGQGSKAPPGVGQKPTYTDGTDGRKVPPGYSREGRYTGFSDGRYQGPGRYVTPGSSSGYVPPKPTYGRPQTGSAARPQTGSAPQPATPTPPPRPVTGSGCGCPRCH